VFSKLVDRIAKKRSLLLTLYAQHHSQIVTRVQWAQGLSEALGMSLAWNRLEKELGVPEIGVDGNEDGPINYIEFLDRFRIDVELFWQNNLPASPNSVASSSTSLAERGAFLQVVYENHSSIVDLFQQLDVKYTGELPTEHFQLGLRKLCELKKVSVTKEQLDEWLPEQKGVTKGHVKYMDFLNRTRFQLQFRQNSPLTLVRSLSEKAKEKRLPLVKPKEILQRSISSP